MEKNKQTKNVAIKMCVTNLRQTDHHFTSKTSNTISECFVPLFATPLF